ncbi:MAG TPA: hypothetical protein VF663_00940 [Telluria sp.]
MHVFFYRRSRRWLIGIALLAGSAVHAAGAPLPSPLRDEVVPPALIGTIGCSHTRAMLVQDFAGQVGLTQRGKTARYSPQQVRAIMNGVDATIEQFCSLLALKTAATQRANLEFLTSNEKWRNTLADPAAVAWLRTNSQFLAEIESLYLLSQLGGKLAPGTGDDARLQRSPAFQDAMDGMKFFAFTDEESAARSLLAMPASRAHLAAVLPARFDVARLAAREQATRTAGTPFLRRYRFDMAKVDTAKSTTIRQLTQAEEKELTAAMNVAVARLKALAKQYAPAGAARSN